jgi:hypothetical protein
LRQDQEIRELIIPYLLGELSPEEQEKLEIQYLNDDSLFEEMRIAEDELIEARYHGELSGPILERFKKQFSKPVRRWNLEFTNALVRYAQASAQPTSAVASRTLQPRKSWLASIFDAWIFSRRPLALACIACIFLLGVSLAYLIRARKEINQLRFDRVSLDQRVRELENQSAAQNTRLEQLASELDQARNSSKQVPPLEPNTSVSEANSLPSIATGVVIARLLRNGNGKSEQVLRVSRAATVLRLEVVIEKGNYERYRVTISSGNREIFSHDKLQIHQTSNGYAVPVEIQLKQLSPKHRYLIVVSGIKNTAEAEEIGQTYFSFLRR